MKRGLKKGIANKFKAEPEALNPETEAAPTAVEQVKADADLKKQGVSKKRGGINKHKTISSQ